MLEHIQMREAMEMMLEMAWRLLEMMNGLMESMPLYTLHRRLPRLTRLAHGHLLGAARPEARPELCSAN